MLLGASLAACAVDTDLPPAAPESSAPTAATDTEIAVSAGALSASQPELWLATFGAEAGGWRSDRHLRFLEDVDGDGQRDAVGFGEDGIYVALSTTRSFGPSQLWLAQFGALPQAGGWVIGRNPRLMADVNGDRRKDVVGFADDGVYVALSTGATFAPATRWLAGFGFDDGWTALTTRVTADVDGDGREDIVGFGERGVSVSRSTGRGFTAPAIWVQSYAPRAGGWENELHPRMLADVTGDGRADIVGFGSAGVYVSRALASSFAAPALWVGEFGYDQGWRIDRHPRLLADVNGDRRQDVVGFDDEGVLVALSTGLGFGAPTIWREGFGYEAGGWRVDQHPRLLGDVNADGRWDVVGFGDTGVYVATSTGTSFEPPVVVVSEFGQQAGEWRVEEHPRMVGRVDGNRTADIVGFGDDGVFVTRMYP